MLPLADPAGAGPLQTDMEFMQSPPIRRAPGISRRRMKALVFGGRPDRVAESMSVCRESVWLLCGNVKAW